MCFNFNRVKNAQPLVKWIISHYITDEKNLYLMRLTFLLAMLTYGLFAQEQVSDIDNYDVFTPTEIHQKLKFILIDGIQYLIEDHEGITISKWENGTFEKRYFLDDLYPDYDIMYNAFDNEYHLVIIQGKYIRVTNYTIEVIDIVTGEREQNIDLTASDIFYRDILDIAGSNILLRSYCFGEQKLTVFNIDSSEFIELPYFFPLVSYDLLNDRMVYVNEDKRAVSEWLFEDKMSRIIFNSTTQIHSITVNADDQRITVLEDTGVIHRISNDNNSEQIGCRIFGLQESDIVHFLTDRYIRIEKCFSNPPRDCIRVININTCALENSFRTEEYNTSFSKEPIIAKNRDQDESYTIIGHRGYYGGSETQYVINHEDFSVTPFNLADETYHNTAVKNNEYIYFVMRKSYDLGLTRSYIIGHDLNSKETKIIELDSTGPSISAVIGFEENGQLIIATNSDYEEPGVRKLQNFDASVELMPLDYNRRLGFHKIRNVHIQGSNLYIHSARKIYRVDHTAELLTSIKERFTRLPLYHRIGFSYYENSTAYAAKNHSDSIMIYTYDTTHGRLDSLKPPIGFKNRLDGIKNIGPLITAAPHYFDLRDNSFGRFDDISYLSNFGIGKEKVFFPRYLSPNSSIGILDINSLELDSIQNIFIRPTVYSGPNNSAYIADALDYENYELYFYEGNDIELIYSNANAKLIKRNLSFGDTEVIDNVPINKRLNNFEFLDKVNDQIVIVSHDMKNTYVNEFENKTGLIIEDWDEGYVVNESDALSYFTVESGLIEIYPIKTDEYINNVIMQGDSMIAFAIYDDSTGMTKLGIFDVRSEELEELVTIDTDSDCNGVVLMAYLSDEKILCSCYIDYFNNKPAIIELSEGKLSQIDNLNSNLTSIVGYRQVYTVGNCIYFTAIITDGSIQWFRVDKNDYDLTPLSEEDLERIIILSSLNSNSIYMEESFDNNISILNSNGQIVESFDSYNKGQVISIAHLSSGVYYIITLDISTGRLRQGSFVKI